MIKSYTFLICAILAEALGTTTLKLSEQFTKPRFGQRHLVEGGHLYFEINALCGKETVAMLRQENYTEVELIQDLYGKDRIVKAKI